AIDGAVAVVTEEDIVAARLVLREEVLDELRAAEPPVVVDLLVDVEIVEVDDIPASSGEAVAGDERMVLRGLRERGDVLRGVHGRPDRIDAAPGRCDPAPSKAQKRCAAGG